MNKQKKLLHSSIAIMLTVVMGIFLIPGKTTTAPQVRTVKLDVPVQYAQYVEEAFDEATLEHDEGNVSFYGHTNILPEEPMSFECNFEAETLMFHLFVTLDSSGETESEDVQGFVDYYGGLNACLEYDDKEYYIGDYKDVEALDALIVGEEDSEIEETGLFGWLVRSGLLCR